MEHSDDTMYECECQGTKELEETRRDDGGWRWIVHFVDGELREDWIVLLMTLSSVCLGR